MYVNQLSSTSQLAVVLFCRHVVVFLCQSCHCCVVLGGRRVVIVLGDRCVFVVLCHRHVVIVLGVIGVSGTERVTVNESTHLDDEQAMWPVRLSGFVPHNDLSMH